MVVKDPARQRLLTGDVVEAGTQRLAIGGEMELGGWPTARPGKPGSLARGCAGTWNASGRGALMLVLRHLKSLGVTHVQLPAYLCESLLLAIKAAALDHSYYPVDENLAAQPDPKKGTALLVIDYFGWLNPSVGPLEDLDASGNRFIEDASQALLSAWRPPRGDGKYLILSPRKFAPSILGGWCNISTKDLSPVPVGLEVLAWRSLAGRLVKGSYVRQPNAGLDPEVEEFYLSAFEAMERYLDERPDSFAVPSFVSRLLESFDWPEIARRRRENWHSLQSALGGKVEPFFRSLPEDVVPLGYVITVDHRDLIRRKLAEQRIYCPVHWPLPTEVTRRDFPAAHRIAARALTLPIDQRYDGSSMDRIADALLRIL
jgi:hypothetical protein